MKAELENQLEIKLSWATIRRRMNEMGYSGRVAQKKRWTSDINIRKRLISAVKLSEKDLRFWQNVI
jgi:hypothetical protein